MGLINEINLDVDDEMIEMGYDIMRIVTIQIITQALFCMNNKEIRFFNETFIQTVLFLCIGIIFYWLIIKNIFRIKKTKDKNV